MSGLNVLKQLLLQISTGQEQLTTVEEPFFDVAGCVKEKIFKREVSRQNISNTVGAGR